MTRVILVMEDCSGNRSIREFNFESTWQLDYEFTKFAQDLTGDDEITVKIDVPEWKPSKRKGKKA